MEVLGPDGVFNQQVMNCLLTRADVLSQFPTRQQAPNPADILELTARYTSELQICVVPQPEDLITMLHPRNCRYIGSGNFGRVYLLKESHLAVKLSMAPLCFDEGKQLAAAIFQRHWLWPRERLSRWKHAAAHPFLTLSSAIVGRFLRDAVDYADTYITGRRPHRMVETTDLTSQIWKMIDEICGAFSRKAQFPQILVPTPRIIFVNQDRIPICYAMDYIPQHHLPGLDILDEISAKREAAMRLGLIDYDGDQNLYFTQFDGTFQLCAVDPQWGFLDGLRTAN